MPLITREQKGSKLTTQEMDGNLEYLQTTLSGSITMTGDINAVLSNLLPIGLKSNTTSTVNGPATITTNKSAIIYENDTYGSSSLGVSLATTAGGGNDGAITIGKSFTYSSGSQPTISTINEFAGKISTPGRPSYLSAITTLRNELGFSYITGISQNAASFGVLTSSDASGSIGIGANMGVGKNSYLFIAGSANSAGVRVLSNEPTLFSVQKTAGPTITDLVKINQSGSLTLAVTASTTPMWTGTDGEIVPATVSGKYLLYMWMNGAWRSGSFV